MYCENCGSKISDDARFCENCGYRVSFEEKFDNGDLQFTVFESEDWKSVLKSQVTKKQPENIGIILTNTYGCSDNDTSRFMETLGRYFEYCQLQGTYYYLLDMAKQRVLLGEEGITLSSVIEVLRQVYESVEPKYLMIVGDRQVVPSARWENPLGDSDDFVDSDLCYWMLDITSPFESVKRAFYACVGRIPTSCRNGFSEACNYFNSILSHGNRAESVAPVALSAEEWSQVSLLNFKNTCRSVYPCPPHSFVSHGEVQATISANNYNFFCFNLHGGMAHDYWVSGNGTLGFSPAHLPNHKKPYILCSEACYGAKPVIREGQGQSILMTAIQSGCFAFCGSTQIAYGIPDSALACNAKPCAADVLIGRFSEGVYNGDTTGEAYFNALVALACSGDRIAAEDIKTMASFALYGDPSLAFVDGTLKSSGVAAYQKSNGRSAQVKGINRIVFPDVRLVVNKRIDEISEKISRVINKYIDAMLPGCTGTPEYYELGDRLGYKAVMKKTGAKGSEILNIYVDRHGNIKSVYASK